MYFGKAMWREGAGVGLGPGRVRAVTVTDVVEPERGWWVCTVEAAATSVPSRRELHSLMRLKVRKGWDDSGCCRG